MSIPIPASSEPASAGAGLPVGTPLNVLVVEDSDDDARIAMRVLERGGFDPTYRRVQTAAEMEGALGSERWDAVISDFGMPGFTGLEALEIFRRTGLDIPFILVSGSIGEETAVAMMRAGVSDYVMKENLTFLAPSLARELKEAAMRAAHRLALRELVQNEEGLRRAQLMAGLAHVITGPRGEFESWSKTLQALIGVDDGGMPASMRKWLEFVHPDDRAIFRSTCIQAGVGGVRASVEYRLRGADGAWLHIRQVMEPISDDAGARGGRRWFNTLQNVTEQKRSEAKMRENEARHKAMFEQTAVGIAHTSLDGRILLANPRFCEMLGFTQMEMMSFGILDLTHLEDIEASSDARSRMVAGTGEPYSRELRLVRKDQNPVWVSVTTSLVRSDNGQPAYFVSIVNDISERKRLEQSMREAETRFRSIFENTVEGIFQISEDRHVITCNSAFARMLGYGSPEDAVGSVRDAALLFADPEDRLRLLEVLRTNGLVHGFETRSPRKDGSIIWVSLGARAMRDEASGSRYTLGMMEDITERKAQQRKIERLSRTHAVLSGINSLIVRVRDRGELFGEACRIAVEAGQFPAAWLAVIDREAGRVAPVAWHGVGEDFIRLLPLDLAGPGLIARAVGERKAMISDDTTQDPRIILKNEVRERGFRSAIVLPLVVGEEAIGVLTLYAGEVGVFDAEELALLRELAGDIAFAVDHIEKANRLDYLAFYDELTGVANRTLFQERMGQYLHAARQTQGKLALVVADVERFKTINDSLGRQAGDELLRQLAGRLGRVTDAANIARISGDQFAIVLPEIKGRSEIGRVIERIWHDCFASAFRINEADLRVSAKAGIALFPNDGDDAEMLFSHAEAALEKAKKTGERYVFHSREMTERVAEQLALENKLRQALEKNEFVLHYQPKVDLETRRVVGVEALIRWQSPDLGLVPPAHFIPLMEETGLILEVGAWALSRAVADYSRWLDLGLPAPRVAVNVSAIQLRRRDFVATVEDALRHGAAPTGIDLEITESLIMDDIESNIEKLKAIRDLGVNVAIDDFGTGYSSLGYLAKLPLQSLKIDRSFIIAMHTDADTLTLVQTIISLAHSLKLKVIAEGVETQDQAKLLQLLRCDQVQGYLYSRPMPFDPLTELLKSGAKF